MNVEQIYQELELEFGADWWESTDINERVVA
jgi:hypothetical protein|nr:MAG TPA: hypothetical protein [Caudoviricetes sp.]